MASSTPRKTTGSKPKAKASSVPSCKNDERDYVMEGAASFAYQVEHERRKNLGFEIAVQVKKFETEEREKKRKEKKQKKEVTLKCCCKDVLNNSEHGIVALRKKLEEQGQRYSEMKQVHNECYGELQRLYEHLKGCDVWERYGEDIELVLSQMQDQESIISLLESEMKNLHIQIENTKAKLQDMSRRIRNTSAVKPPAAALELTKNAKNDNEQPKSDGDVGPSTGATGLLPKNTKPGQDSDDNDRIVEYDTAPLSPKYSPNFPEGASNKQKWEAESEWV